MKRVKKIFVIILASLLGLVLVLALAVSPVAKSYILKHDKELIGRELAINKLRVNVLTGAVCIKDLVLYEDDGMTPFVQFQKFRVKLRLRALLQKRIQIDHVLLSALQVNVEQQAEHFNFDSLIDFFSSSDSTSVAHDTLSNKEPSDYGVVVNDINIERSGIRYSDMVVGSEFMLRDISVKIAGIDFSSMKTNVGIDLAFSNGGTLHSRVELADDMERYKLYLQLNKLNFSSFEPYLKQSLAVDSVQGLASFDLVAEGLTDHIMDFNLNGGLSLSSVSAQDLLGNEWAYLDTANIVIDKINLEKRELCLKELFLSGLRSEYMILADSSTNFDKLFLPVNDSAVNDGVADSIAPVADSASQPFHLQIADLRLENVSLAFEDKTFDSAFRYQISDLTVSSTDFSMNAASTLKLDAVLNNVGAFHVIWKGNLSDLQNHNLTLDISNLKFADFSPYSVRLFGFPLEKGTLSFQSQNIIDHGNLNGINKLEIASPKVGEKLKSSKPEYKVPLKLGFYLLTDKKGKLSVDLPVSGNVDDPDFSYKKAIIKVFSNILLKVVSSPFAFLSDDQNCQYVPFDLFMPDFNASQYSLFDDVADVLTDKSQMNVDFVMQFNYDDVIEELSLLQVRRDYYLSQHPELDPNTIDMLSNEAIRSISIKDAGFKAFVDHLSDSIVVKKKSDVLKSVMLLHQSDSEHFLDVITESHNKLLLDYMVTKKGINPDRVSVKTMDVADLKKYSKAMRYSVGISYSDEVLEEDVVEN